MSDVEGDQGPKSTFTTYVAEGDQLCLKKEYVKAIESYSMALVLQPDDKNCLVARSKCYLKMGDSENALSDAEASLRDDKEFFKGLYHKAEALYTMGDFEFALVFYHRGHKLRPELQEFRLGIQKAQEAIENSVGSPSSVKLENKGDLSLFLKGEEGKKGRSANVSHSSRRKVKQNNQETTKTERTSKQLLGELYNDKEYLEKLLKDEDLVKGKMRDGERLQGVLLNCVSYLDTCTEFWRQQKPIYARERDCKLMQEKWNKTRLNPPSDPTHYVLKSLEEIDAALASGDAEGSLKKAQEVRKTVQGWSEFKLPNKKEVLANLHSCMGNALIDLGDLAKALENHQIDLQLATDCKLADAKSRALDNIGRVYVHMGNYTQAIDAWVEKIPLVRGRLEETWLFHEIGCCYLELLRYTEAAHYGRRCLAAADEIADQKWQLNASVLVAQSELKLCDYKSGVSHFTRALDHAKALQDDHATDAIQKALHEASQCSEQ